MDYRKIDQFYIADFYCLVLLTNLLSNLFLDWVLKNEFIIFCYVLRVTCYVVIFFSSNIESAASAGIGETAAVTRFTSHAQALRKAIEENTYIPLGREGFPLDPEIRRRVFGRSDLVTVAAYNNKIKSFEDALESAQIARKSLRGDERQLTMFKSWQSGEVLEQTEADLLRANTEIGKATFVIKQYPAYIKGLQDAYAAKKYAEIVNRKMRDRFMEYVREHDPEFFAASEQHHQSVLDLLLPE